MDPETGKFAGGILSPLSSQRSDGPREAQRPAGRRVGLIAWGALITCLAIAGFIMAAWSTHEAHTASNEVQIASSAVLVADLNHLSQYPGYVLVTNLFRGTGYWAPRPPMPHYRSDFGVVSWNGSAVLFGGLSNDPTNVSIPLVLADVTEYNGVYNTTTPRASMPSNRTRFGWGLVNDKLYVFGGVNDVDGFNVLSDMAIYDLVADQWTSGTAQLNVPRSDSCSGVINGKIYTMGGYGTDNGNTLSSIEEYDPATNTWRLLAQQMSTSRGDCGAVASGGAIYVMGGTVKTPPDCNNPDWWTCYQFQQSMERININADGSATITQLANMTYTRGDFGIIETSPGRLLVAGGETSDPTLNVSRLLAQPWVEEYDVRDNHWTLKAPLPEPSFRFAMARTGDQVLKFGGHPSCTETDQGLDDRCRRNGLNNVVAYSDVVYPNVYVLARTEPPRLHWW